MRQDKIAFISILNVNKAQCKQVGLITNSRIAIAGAVFGLLLVFYDSKRSIGEVLF